MQIGTGNEKACNRESEFPNTGKGDRTLNAKSILSFGRISGSRSHWQPNFLKLTLRVIQEKGTDHRMPNPTQLWAEFGEQVSLYGLVRAG